jgi:hypothetical protein
LPRNVASCAKAGEQNASAQSKSWRFIPEASVLLIDGAR